MRARVEVQPGRLEIWQGDPDALMRRWLGILGKRPSERDLTVLAGAWRYDPDPEEIWRHPEVLVARARAGASVGGDCEDWTAAVSYLAERPTWWRMSPPGSSKRHVWPVWSQGTADLSAVAELLQRKQPNRALAFAQRWDPAFVRLMQAATGGVGESAVSRLFRGAREVVAPIAASAVPGGPAALAVAQQVAAKRRQKSRARQIFDSLPPVQAVEKAAEVVRDVRDLRAGTPVTDAIDRAARDSGLPRDLVRAIAQGESGGRADLRGGAGGRYYGLWQLRDPDPSPGSQTSVEDYDEAHGTALADAVLTSTITPAQQAEVWGWEAARMRREWERALPGRDWTRGSDQALLYWGWLTGWSSRTGAIAAAVRAQQAGVQLSPVPIVEAIAAGRVSREGLWPRLSTEQLLAKAKHAERVIEEGGRRIVLPLPRVPSLAPLLLVGVGVLLLLVGRRR